MATIEERKELATGLVLGLTLVAATWGALLLFGICKSSRPPEPEQVIFDDVPEHSLLVEEK